MNSFFKKNKKRKWTWISPDGTTKNKIDFITTNRKNIVQDVTVINRITVGTDHRLVRSKIVINTKGERDKMMTRGKIGKWSAIEDKEAYQNFISSELRKVDDLREQELDVETINIQINETL